MMLVEPQGAGAVRKWARVVATGVLLAGSATVLVVVALFAFAAAVPGNIDDTFIVLVYARHLLRDGALFWNAGDGPVEGYTSPLDLIVKTVGTALLPEDALQAAFWSSLFLHCLCPLLMLALVLSRLSRGNWLWRWVVALAAGLSVAASRNLAFGSSFLLETPLFAANALGVLWLLGRPRAQLTTAELCAVPLSLGALVWSRPEGLPVALVSLTFFIAHQRRSLSRATLIRLVVAVAVIVLSLVVFRLAYFGEWAPNTYYAKTSSSRWNEIEDGLVYLSAASRSAANVIVLGAAAIGWVLLLFRSAWQPEGRTNYVHAWSLAAVSTAGVIWAGGDNYAGGRFLAVPTCLAIFVLAVGSLCLRPRLRWLGFAPLILLAFLELSAVRASSGFARSQMDAWPTSVDQFECQARAFRRVAAVDPRLAVAQSDCQRFKFFSDSTRVIDLHGLSDRRIAHEPAAGRVVWGRYTNERSVAIGAPIWIWGYAWWSHQATASMPLSRLVGSEELVRRFVGHIPVPRGETAALMVRNYTTASVKACGVYLNFLVRKKHIRAFRRAGIRVGVSHPWARTPGDGAR